MQLLSLFICIICIGIVPFLSAIIQKVKAFLVGKQGPPLLINYYTLSKLFKKGSVYSRSTTFVFRIMPVVSLAVAATTLLFLPIAKLEPVISFSGDIILVLYLLGIARFLMVTAAMDTASPFEGMGAAREVYFSFLCEATLFAALLLFYKINGSISLDGYFTGRDAIHIWGKDGALILLVSVALFIVLLAENARVPVDDPATHLELTMIHEVMILDHSGPDLAFIELGAFVKLFFYACVIANLLMPDTGSSSANFAMFFCIVFCIYVAIGIVESITARFKMRFVPKFMLTSFAIAFFALILAMEI